MGANFKQLDGSPISFDEARRTIKVVEESRTLYDAAIAMGLSTRGLQARLRKAKKRHGLEPSARKILPKDIIAEIEFPEFPDEDISVEDIIKLQSARFAKRKASHDAHTWFPIKLKDNKPIAICWFGDPHIDDNGCNWPALERHMDVCRDTPGIYAVNIGDTTNCWGGRLIRKYADQDTSAKTARRLAEWFLLKGGVRWIVWLYGNHEHMGDGMHVLAEMAKRLGTQKVAMHDWEARFVLCFPNGAEFRINCAHDFPGNSMWNPNHGPVKAAMFGDRIDLLVCGHKHHWAISQWELPEQGVTPLMIRTRGYKHLDDFSRKLGKYDQEEGQSILVVFDPNTKGSGRIIPFVDVAKGAEYLTWLREQTQGSIRPRKGAM